MTLGLWIDPNDAAQVTLASPESEGIVSVTDKSGSANTVLGAPAAVLLCDFNGSDAAASPPAYTSQDKSARVPSFNGNAQLDTAQKKWGTSSALFDGTGDYITFPDSEDWHFGSGDFTIELWVRFNDTTGQQNFVSQWPGASNRGWILEMLTSGTLRFVWSTTGSDVQTHSMSWSPSTATWYHVAFVRNGNTTRGFVDGTQVGSDDSTISGDNLFNSTAVLSIGGRSDTTMPFDGWIDDLRITKGRALYWANFTAPTAAHKVGPALLTEGFGSPEVTLDSLDVTETVLYRTNASPDLVNMEGPDLSVVVAHGVDVSVFSPEDAASRTVSGTLVGVEGVASPLDDTGWRLQSVDNYNIRGSVGDENSNFVDLVSPEASEVLLANFNGADAATTYSSEDAKKRQATFTGNAALDTAQSKFGGSSCVFDGTGDYVEFPDSADWEIGSGEFTAECWVRFNGDPGTADRFIMGHYTITGDERGWLVDLTNNNLRFAWTTDGTAGTFSSVTGSWNPVGSQWYHVCVERRSGSVYGYVDGSQIFSAVNSVTPHAATAPFSIGGSAGAGGPMNGWIDEVRVTIGSHIYGGTFTAPTKPFASSYSTTGNAISGMVLDQTANMLVGYNNGAYAGSHIYGGTLGFVNDLQIGEYEGGIVNEVVYVNRALRTDERQHIEGYLAHKWRYTDVLPATHPFKDQAPDIVNNAELVVNFIGIDNTGGSPEFLAETGQVVTFVGTAAIVDNEFKYGGSSLLLDGNSDKVTIPDSADWHFGTGDFTIEAWVRFDATPTNAPIVAQWGASSVRGFLFEQASSTSLQFVYSETGADVFTESVSFTPTLNQWYHVAVSRKGADLRFFVDGAQVGADKDVTGQNLFNTTIDLEIGGRNDNAGYFPGNIDSVRVTKGTGLYEHDFTPPHRGFRLPVTAGLIANFNGLDAAASPPGYTSEDSGARPATFGGNAELDTAHKKFGVSSAKFDGTGDYITFPDSTAWDLSNNDFTVELWVRFNGDPGAATMLLIGQWTSTGDQRAWALNLVANALQWNWTTAGTAPSSSATSTSWNPAGDTWYHVAIERFDDILFFYVDGVLLGSIAHTPTYFAAAAPLELGALELGTSQDFNGWIDGVRIVNGTALRSSVAAPYAKGLTADTDDVTCNFEGANGQTSYTTDDTNAISLTFNSTAHLTTVEKARGTSCLDVQAEAESVEVPSGNGMALGTGDFAIECFCKYTAHSTSSYEAMIDQRIDGTVQVRPYIGTNNAGGQWVFYVSGTDRITSTVAPSLGRWYHVVVQRVSAVTRMYIDGVQVGSDYADSNNYLDGPITIGSRWDQGASNNSFQGYIDGFRWRVGSALYQEGFTPPIDAAGEPIITW